MTRIKKGTLKQNENKQTTKDKKHENDENSKDEVQNKKEI